MSVFKYLSLKPCRFPFWQISIRKPLLCLVAVLYVLRVHAQSTDSIPNTPWDWDKTSYLAPTVFYLNDNVYLGRKDSVQLPYFGPSVSIHTRTGFTLSTALNFTNRYGATKLDMWALEGGYDGSIGQHMLLGAYAGSLNYQHNSTNVRADVGGYAGGYASYDNEFVSPQITITSVFGTKVDWVTAFELEHEFDLNEDRISVIPTAKINAGTQHYYTAYVVTKLNKKGQPVNRNATSSGNKFSVLDYELTAPFGWNIKRWHVDLIPTYFVPVNPVVLANGTETYQEKLTNSFTAQLSLSYRFILHEQHSTPTSSNHARVKS
jgi:hypothetical protein